MADEMRIQVMNGGPYVVSGGVPLTEMAPVQTLNGENVDWHVLRELDESRDLYALCRCGRSNDKPYCDGSHAAEPWAEAETADRRPMADRANRIEGPAGVMLDDESICIGAGFCGTRTTSAWDLINEEGDEAGDRVTAMVARCPTGRLAMISAGGDSLEPAADPEIAVVPGGPLWVRGGVSVESADGAPWPEQSRRTLCRCGASNNKPFCDGTHSDLHFDER